MPIHRTCAMGTIHNTKGRGWFAILSTVPNSTFGDLEANGLSDFSILQCLSLHSFKGGDSILVTRTWSFEAHPTDCVERRSVPRLHSRTREGIFPIANVYMGG